METEINPDTIPEQCPGPKSETAGQSTPCQGCPNQALCASGEASLPDPAIEQIKERMGTVKHKFVVLSGKGGVGKSTVTATLAQALAQDENRDICVLDVDICGPSIPMLFGLEGENVHQSSSGWSPVYAKENLGVVSVGFLLSSPDQAVIWRGPRKNGLIKQFLRDVDWGPIDFLLIDTPPGTSDEHLSIIQYLSEAGVDGALVVTTPQEVALLDVRKELNFCKKVNLKVLGVVENMSGFTCGNCKEIFNIFPKEFSGGAEKMCSEFDVPFLGSIPLDPNLGQSCDEGRSIFDLPDAKNSPTVNAYERVAKELLSKFKVPIE